MWRYDKIEREKYAVVAGPLPTEATAGEGAEVAAALRPATATSLSGGATRQREFESRHHHPAHRHKDLEQQQQQPCNLDLARWKGERFSPRVETRCRNAVSRYAFLNGLMAGVSGNESQFFHTFVSHSPRFLLAENAF